MKEANEATRFASEAYSLIFVNPLCMIASIESDGDSMDFIKYQCSGKSVHLRLFIFTQKLYSHVCMLMIALSNKT